MQGGTNECTTFWSLSTSGKRITIATLASRLSAQLRATGTCVEHTRHTMITLQVAMGIEKNAYVRKQSGKA